MIDLADDPSFPFVDFIEDHADYVRSQRFWADAFHDMRPSEAAGWVDWMADPFSDGHPIFSVIDGEKRRAVLLQQVAISDDPCWFKCWMSRSESRGDVSTEILVIETFVSRQGRALFQELASAWCITGRSFTWMEELTLSVTAAALETFGSTDFGWPEAGLSAPTR